MVLAEGGLGILIGLETVSNLETSLETSWLVPGLGSGHDWALARFLEDDILSIALRPICLNIFLFPLFRYL